MRVAKTRRVSGVRLVVAIAACSLALTCVGCDSESDDGASGMDDGADLGAGDSGTLDDGRATAETGANDEDPIADEVVIEPWAVGPDCLFDEELAGKGLGKHLENVSLVTYEGDRYDLHQNCGQPDKKVVWVFFVTEWCGACEGYAHIVEEYYEMFKDDGLEIMWIMGEDANEQPVTAEWCDKFVKQKGLTFTVLTDFKYYQAQSSFPYNGGALPHQYIVDATNMELVFERGGVGEDAEQVIWDMLGVDAPQ